MKRLSSTLLAPPEKRCDLLLVAGEHSGDQHAAALARALRRASPDLGLCALGGPALAGAGAQLLHDLTASSVVGLFEVLKHYPYFRAVFDALLRWIAEHRPRVVCLVDYPGFNLRLAAALAERGLSAKGGGAIRVVFYISPQIWAWKPKRRFAMARTLDALAAIFPFEPASYADTLLPVDFVGHPFATPEYLSPVGHDPDGPILLLPGSRVAPVRRIFPALLGGFSAYRPRGRVRNAVALYPSEAIRRTLAGVLADYPDLRGAVELRPVEAGKRTAAAVLTSSGTMSLHCALAGLPGAIAYRASPITYWIGKHLVKIPYLGIANLLLREAMYPEYLQSAAAPRALARELENCLEDPQRLARTRRQAESLRTLLSQPASGTAADWLRRQLATAAPSPENLPS